MTRVLLAALGCLALAVPAGAAAAPPTLTGTVGPGATITLTRAGKPVTTLKAGSYRLVVRDRSAAHNFRLRGPGLNREYTGVRFVGTRTFTVRLKAGRYTFVCDPHAFSMKGGFRVR